MTVGDHVQVFYGHGPGDPDLVDYQHSGIIAQIGLSRVEVRVELEGGQFCTLGVRKEWLKPSSQTPGGWELHLFPVDEV